MIKKITFLSQQPICATTTTTITTTNLVLQRTKKYKTKNQISISRQMKCAEGADGHSDDRQSCCVRLCAVIAGVEETVS